MDTAPASAKVRAWSPGRLLEVWGVNLEDRAARRALAAASAGQNRSKQGGLQVGVGLHARSTWLR